MRTFYAFLALTQVRLALLDYARAELLSDRSDEAVRRARARIVAADGLGQRAGLPQRLMPLR